MKKSHLLGAVCAFVFAYVSTSPKAELVNIDFNDLAAGIPVTNQYSSQGITFSLVNSPIAGPTTHALTGINGPNDIFGATGNAISPGDDYLPPFWDISMSFIPNVDYFSILVIDAEEAISVQTFSGGSSIAIPVVTTNIGFHRGPPYNGPVNLIEVGEVGANQSFDRVVLVITPNDGPELFDNVQFNTIPIPSALWLFSSGLLGLIGISRRKKAP